MKYTFIHFLFLFPICLFGQNLNYDNILGKPTLTPSTGVLIHFMDDGMISISRDSTKINICKERGHVHGGSSFTTLAYCEPYLIETDSTTIRVYPSCNVVTSSCMRCGDLISEKEKEIREIIWRKNKKQ